MRVGATSQSAQDPRPVLMIGQPVSKALDASCVLQADESIIQALILDAVPIQLARQPFMAIDVNLHRKGEPSLQAHVHPTENPIDEIEIYAQAPGEPLRSISIHWQPSKA